MTFKGKEPDRTKIIITNKTNEKTQHCFYCDNNAQKKLHKFKHICGTLIRIQKGRKKRDTIKLLKAYDRLHFTIWFRKMD